MPPYPVLCYGSTCDKLAVFKIAATWSDGITKELKTYGLTCADCLGELYLRSCAKHKACRVIRGESLGAPEIFALSRGQRDLHLARREDLERELAGS
jgi:hypothetical protein